MDVRGRLLDGIVHCHPAQMRVSLRVLKPGYYPILLTDAKIRNTKPAEKPIKLTDGDGLYMEVRSTGAKVWRYPYRIAGKENIFAVGEYFNDRHGGHISLNDARAERNKARTLAKQGIHPAHSRKTARLANHLENANTFEAVGA